MGVVINFGTPFLSLRCRLVLDVRGHGAGPVQVGGVGPLGEQALDPAQAELITWIFPLIPVLIT